MEGVEEVKDGGEDIVSMQVDGSELEEMDRWKMSKFNERNDKLMKKKEK